MPIPFVIQAPRVVRVEYHPSPAGARLLADGDEILFADLRCGLDIVCDWLPDGRSVNGATCQVFVEIPFPMGTDGMVLWGEEIVGYTPLNLAAHVTCNGPIIRWMPSAASLRSLERVLPYRMRDVVCNRTGRFPAMTGVAAAEGAEVYVAAAPVKEHAQYLCYTPEAEVAGVYGLVFNWERPGDYDAVVCASEDESGDEAVASVRVHGGVPELVETGRRQRGEGRPARITIKQVTDGVLYNAGGVRGRVPTRLRLGAREGFVGGRLAEGLTVVYPTRVENLLFPASMVEGHYQDRSTFARLVVKVGLLRSDGAPWAASPDFERHFKLVAVAVATGGAVSADPYRSTDGHPSIGGHLLFDPPVAE